MHGTPKADKNTQATPRMTQTHRNLSQKPDGQEARQPKSLAEPPRLKMQTEANTNNPERLTVGLDGKFSKYRPYMQGQFFLMPDIEN
jgi:hypothetical protein